MKNRFSPIIIAVVFSVVGYGTPCVPAAPYSETSSANCTATGYQSLLKVRTFTITWPGPSYVSKNPKNWIVEGTGQSYKVIDGSNVICQPCYALYDSPAVHDRYVGQTVKKRAVVISLGVLDCATVSQDTPYENPASPVCACSPSSPPPSCPPDQHRDWNEVTCQYSACLGGTPIIIDLDGDGYRLTSAANGVMFDLDAKGSPERWSWTAAGTDEAFLVLDRNGNGHIDNGKELFGNATEQPRVREYNGFNALSVFDTNNDKWIDGQDAVYAKLRLWVDSNHNGVSEASEFRTLPAEGVDAINIDYQLTRAMDQYGNRFRFRAPVRGRNLGRWAWDVIFVKG